MNIKIELLKKTDFSLEEVLRLIKESFQERLLDGLNFTCSRMSIEQFRQRVSDGVVFVAIDDGKKLVGTGSLHVYIDDAICRYGYVEYLAVHPAYKRSGIGSMILNAQMKYLEERKCLYALSDTAVGATSSVRCHLKNGFKKIGVESYRSTDYYSILFRKNIVPSKKWDNRLFTSFVYFRSCISKRLFYKPNGQKRAWFNWFVSKVKKK